MRLLEKEQDRGQPVPSLEAQPVVWEHLTPVWAAWQELNSLRLRGFAGEPLQPQAIDAWFRLRGFTDRRLISDWFELFMALEIVWLRKTREAQEKTRAE